MTNPRLMAAAALACGLVAAGSAGAETFQTEYNARLTGLPVGTMSIKVDVEGGSYVISGSTRVRGMLRLFSDGKGEAMARGAKSADAIRPAHFSYRYAEKDDVDTLDMGFADGEVRTIEPAPKKPGDKRVPLAQEHFAGAVDPLSAFLFPFDAEDLRSGCERSLPIFDGKTRYDLVLSYARTETVERIDGYSGPAAVCSVRYVPVSGHRKDGKDTKEWSRASAEIWMAPLGETGALFPVRIRVGTSWGPLVIEASRFEGV